MKTRSILLALTASVLFISCGKKSDRTGETSVKEETKKEQTADQEKQRIQDSITAAGDEMRMKEKKLEEAKMEQMFLGDPNGQWVVSAEASTNYGNVENDALSPRWQDDPPPRRLLSSRAWPSSVYRIFTHGRLSGKHNAVRPIQDSVRYIRCLGPRGSAIVRHRLEHLGRRDDRFRAHVCQTHQPLLHDRDRLDWNLYPEVPPGDHDSISDLQNFIDMIQGPRPLDLGNDERMEIEIASCFTDGGNVCGALYEGLTDRIETLLLGEHQPALIFMSLNASNPAWHTPRKVATVGS